MLIAGVGRSGTTWLAEIIASQHPCRIVFEPFHSRYVDGFNPYQYFQYMDPSNDDDHLLEFCSKVFKGELRNDWLDQQLTHIFPKYRLIKEITANLFLKWIHVRFPELPLLFVIRHPCAVALSRMKWNWATDQDIIPFLAQPELIRKHLPETFKLIHKVETEEEKHAIVWCINNLVPIHQFSGAGLNVVFYERLCVQPQCVIPRIFETLNLEYDSSIWEMIPTPSSTTRDANTRNSETNHIDRWRHQLSTQQVIRILSIVKAFGLDYLYNDSPFPQISTFEVTDHSYS